MSNEEIHSLVSVIKDSKLLEPTDITHLDSLESRCSGPGELARELLERGSLTRYQTELLFQGEGKKLILGQYVLMEPIGEGGMGTVYKARHRRLKRIVALKVIRKDASAGSMAIRRFEQEMEAAAALNHPNIVGARDANEEDNTVFFVMEYVEGIDLGKLVQRFGKVPVGNAADYIAQAARGLQHAHEKGMVHRDIKPSNLLLAYPDAVVKILDMGLARLRGAAEEPNKQLTFTGMVMGTPDFISPEQAKDSRLADIRSDLYSLGCAFFYLLTGHVPFPEGGFTEKLLKHSLEEAPPLEKDCPDAPPEICYIVKRLMAKRPEERYQEPMELVKALEPFATPEKSAERFRPPKAEIEDDLQWANKLVSQTDATLQKIPAAKKLDVTDPMKATPSSTGSGTGLLPGADAKWDTLAPPAKPKPREEQTAQVTAPPVARIEPKKEEAAVAPPPRQPAPASGAMRGGVAIAAGLVLAVAAVIGWKALGGFGNGGNVAVAPTSSSERVVPAPLATKPETKREKPPEPELLPDPRVVETVVKPPPPPPPPPVGVIVQLPKRDFKNRGEPLRAAIAQGGRWLVAGWTDSLWGWNLDKSKPGRAADHQLNVGIEYPVNAVAAAADGRFLLGTAEEVIEKGKVPRLVPVMWLWDPNSSEKTRAFPGHTQEITCVAFSPQGNRAISGSEDRTVRLWDLRAGKEVFTMRKHQAKILTAAISNGGNRALSGGRDSFIVLWDLDTGKEIGTLVGHSSFVTCVAFSPDDKFAVSAGYDKKIILWDLTTRKKVRTYAGHDDVIWSVAFSPDGKYIVSGGKEQAVRLWDVGKVEYIHEYTDHKSDVLSVAFSADGKYILSVSNDNTARRWPVQTDR